MQRRWSAVSCTLYNKLLSIFKIYDLLYLHIWNCFLQNLSEIIDIHGYSTEGYTPPKKGVSICLTG